MDTTGRKCGLLIFWGDNVKICQMLKFDFCIEIEVESDSFEGKFWLIFLYASTNDNIRKMQWECLKQKSASCDRKWIMGGDFNGIISQEDKHRGKRRRESSFIHFRSFIREMEMEDVNFRGWRWTWANNRQGEEFIEERLNMFFGLAEWIIECDQAGVKHILAQALDRSMLLLYTKPQ